MKTIQTGGVTFSLGNSKLGPAVANLSLAPLLTCAKGLPCRKDCYAVKTCKLYATAATAWMRNTLMAAEDRTQFFCAVEQFLEAKTPKRFRLHVSGDFMDQDYLDQWIQTIARHPAVEFLAFTKRLDLVFPSTLPGNLVLVASMWPGFTPPKNTDAMPHAWLRTKETPDPRIPEDAFTCPGSCATCNYCWRMKPKDNVIFDKH